MKNLKYILLSVIVMLCGSSVNAQSLKIYKNDGSFITVPYSELDSIVAVDEEKQPEYEFVDLGLSVKWAACNIGAKKPEDYGYYFAWGETETKESYDSDNSVTNKKPVEDFSGNPEYDAASAQWGGAARMPTLAEFQELLDGCTWELSTQNGVSGMLVTGSNGNSIFLPAAGGYTGTSLDLAGQIGFYWSSTPFEENDDRAYLLNIYFFGDHTTFWGYRKLGYSIRPVSD